MHRSSTGTNPGNVERASAGVRYTSPMSAEIGEPFASFPVIRLPLTAVIVTGVSEQSVGPTFPRVLLITHASSPLLNLWIAMMPGPPEWAGYGLAHA